MIDEPLSDAEFAKALKKIAENLRRRRENGSKNPGV
jgi:hypothetical protein